MGADEKVCPRCAETIKRAALVCRYCGHEFDIASAPPTEPTPSGGLESKWLPTGAQEKPKPSTEKPSDDVTKRNSLIGCIGLVLVLGMVGQCVGSGGGGGNTVASSSLDDETSTDAPIMNGVAPVQPDLAKSNWATSSYRDEVRGKMVYTASITSENEVEFDFPYAGGSTLEITVRKHPQYGEDVVFQISDGQFICGIYDCKGMISFDGKAEPLSLGPSDDHDSKTLFSEYPGGIIGKLKSADRVVVELPFYQEGNRQFTFDTKGLTWPPKG